MRTNRTLRRPTRWSPDEWRRIEEAARERSVPPARFVREAALSACDGGAPAPARRRRRVRDELVHQLQRVLNNLRQLERAAAEEGAPGAEHAAGFTAALVEEAVRSGRVTGQRAAALVPELVEAGRVLNEIVHRAHTPEALPPDQELIEAVARVYRFLKFSLP